MLSGTEDVRRLGWLARIVVFGVLAIGVLSTTVAAQVTSGTILGNVTDSAGSVVPGATVTTTNTDTGATRSATTDTAGTFLVSALPPGPYKVTVTLKGFDASVHENLTLAMGANLRVDARLSVAGVVEKVDVVATALSVDTRSSSVGMIVDSRRMRELPMLNRSTLSLVVLAPGVTSVSIPDAVIDQRSAPSVVAGGTAGRTNQNDIQLDGGSMTTSLYNRLSNLPSPDAIQEFQVLTNNYSAEQGRAGGVSMQAITKSGGNAFHGGAWEYFRDDAFNGTNFFAVRKPFLRRNQFGGNLGGPIKHDRTFFFANYEGLRMKQQTVLLFNPPTAAQRAGNFSALTTEIIDPSTGAPFAGKQIRTDRFDPMAVKILETYVPVPNQPDGTYNKNTDRPVNGDQIAVKIDHKLSDANTLSGRWYRDKSKGVSAAGNIEELWTTRDNLLESYTFADTHVFSAKLVGEGRVSISNISTIGPVSTNNIGPRRLGAVYDQDGPVERAPNISVAGFFSMSQIEPWTERSRDYSAYYKASWNSGRHNFRVGFDIMHQSQRLNTQWDSSGSHGFDGSVTGNAFADFLLGRNSSFLQAAVLNNLQRLLTWRGFVQDDLKLKRLTINLGARIERYNTWREDGGRESTFRDGQQSTRYPGAPKGLVFSGDTGIPPGLVPGTTRIAPRVGFAWDVLGDGRTALRGGYGQFGAAEGSIIMAQTNEVPPFTPLLDFQPNSLRDPYGSWTSPFPYVVNPQGEGLFPDAPIEVNSLAGNWKPGIVHQFNATIQRQLGHDIVFDVGYVGSRGRGLTRLNEINMAVFGPGATAGNADDRRPHKGFGGITMSEPGSYSNYNSLQVNATKQFSRGYTLQVTYTFGKTMDDGPVGETGSSVQNPNNRAADYARANNSRTHVFRTNGMWELPGLQGRPAAVRYVLGGWRLAGIMTLLSGTPFNVTSGVDRAIVGASGGGLAAQRPNLQGDPKLPSDRSRAEKIAKYFNPDKTTMWTLPALGQFGNAPRNVLIGPGLFNTDLSLMKQFRWHESKRRVQVGMEGFNVLDTVNLSNPTTGRNSSTFGQIRSAGATRQLQMALRFDF